MRKHYTTAQRAELTSLVTTGQATLRAAAARVGVPESTAYYWLRASKRRAAAVALAARSPRLSREAERALGSLTPSPFARLVREVERASVVLLRVGEVTVEVRPGFDAVLLRATLAALTEPRS